MADFHGAAIERFSKLVTRHSNLREAIRQALAHDRKGESLQAVKFEAGQAFQTLPGQPEPGAQTPVWGHPRATGGINRLLTMRPQSFSALTDF